MKIYSHMPGAEVVGGGWKIGINRIKSIFTSTVVEQRWSISKIHSEGGVQYQIFCVCFKTDHATQTILALTKMADLQQVAPSSPANHVYMWTYLWQRSRNVKIHPSPLHHPSAYVWTPLRSSSRLYQYTRQLGNNPVWYHSVFRYQARYCISWDRYLIRVKYVARLLANNFHAVKILYVTYSKWIIIGTVLLISTLPILSGICPQEQIRSSTGIFPVQPDDQMACPLKRSTLTRRRLRHSPAETNTDGYHTKLVISDNPRLQMIS